MIRSYSQHIPADMGAAIDSGSEDFARTSGSGKPGVATMRLLSYNRSSDRGGSRRSLQSSTGSFGVRTKKRDYDSAPDDDDFTLTGSLSRRSGEALSSRGLRYSSDEQIEEPSHAERKQKPVQKLSSREEKARDRGMLSDDEDGDDYSRLPKKQLAPRRDFDSIEQDSDPKRNSSSQSSMRQRYSSNKHDDDENYDELGGSDNGHDEDTRDTRDDRVGGGYGSRTFDSGTAGSGSAFGLDSTHSVDADEGTVSNFDGTDTMDFNQTVNTDVSMPDVDVEQQADEYEREVREDSSLKDNKRSGGSGRTMHGLPPATPPAKSGTPGGAGSTGGNLSSHMSAGTASPFDAMASDFDDDGSLDLSQSESNFGGDFAQRWPST
jgi:hypothetical protein